MNNFKILVCEDLIKDVRNIKLYLTTLNEEMDGVNIICNVKSFEETYDLLNSDYDFLILDLYDDEVGGGKGGGYLGENILMHNSKNIPTIVYTSKGDEVRFDLHDMQQKYPYLLGKITKLQHGENLKAYLKKYIIGNNILDTFFTLYNEHDLILINSLITIGTSNFNEIIYQISKHLGCGNNIVVHRMTSGLSGAILFKLEYEGQFSILKLSKEIEKLKSEHTNALKLYHKFPSRLINHIEYQEFYSYDKSVLGILIKEVDNSKTFFEFVINSATTKAEIVKYLNDLFLDDQGMKNHYHSHRLEKESWPSIFKKINDQKFLLIKKSFKELSPIIERYYTIFDIQDFRRLTIQHDYEKLGNESLLSSRFMKHIVLSHGDFHSNNILIQSGNHPVLIDTGSIAFQHWALDFCRLIVHLVITGLDHDKIEYFELSSIPDYINIFEKILAMERFDNIRKNQNISDSILWLIENIENVFENEFDKVEFHLALLKEFLQVSYRVETIPPNKRAFALIAAHMCMLSANELTC